MTQQGTYDQFAVLLVQCFLLSKLRGASVNISDEQSILISVLTWYLRMVSLRLSATSHTVRASVSFYW